MKFLMLLVLLGVVAFFAPAPLGHAEESIEIATSRDKVWGVVGDVTSARLWDPGMKDLKVTSDTKIGPGTVRFADGALVKTQETVREWAAYNKVTFDVSHDPKITKFETSTITLEPGENGGTHVTWSLDYQMTGGYLGHFADKFLLGSVHQGRISEGLPNLKRYAETGETPITL
ncbi:MAG: SRPBCC family protein [Candidatus Eisenbacteria bacterium]